VVNRVLIDRSKLSSASASFASRLFKSLPELEQHARMEPNPDRVEQFELIVEVQSPTGDPHRSIVIWMEDGEPSLAFGTWHTHGGLFGEIQSKGCEGLIDTARAILRDQFVLCYDMGGENDGRCGVLDLRNQDAIAEELTNKYSPGKVEIRSWSGSADRGIGLNDL